VKEPSAAISEAVYQKLINAAGVTAFVGSSPARIWDKIPDAPTYPYIRVGDDQAVGDSNSCWDGWEFFATIHIFSRHPQYPRLEAKDIASQVGIALGNNASLIAPAGFHVSEVELEQSRVYFEADGVTAHGVMTFRFGIDDGA
jgi:hypothetical protein